MIKWINGGEILKAPNKGAFSFKTCSSHAGLKTEFKLIDWALYWKSFTVNIILVSSEPKSIHKFDFLFVSMTLLLVLFCLQTVLASKRFENNSLIIPRRSHVPGFISSFKWFGSPLYLVSQNLFSVVSYYTQPFRLVTRFHLLSGIRDEPWKWWIWSD